MKAQGTDSTGLKRLASLKYCQPIKFPTQQTNFAMKRQI